MTHEHTPTTEHPAATPPAPLWSSCTLDDAPVTTWPVDPPVAAGVADADRDRCSDCDPQLAAANTPCPHPLWCQTRRPRT